MLNQFNNQSVTVTLPSGEELLIRPLKKTDAAALGQYLRNLSAESQSRFGPHPFDQETVNKICAELNPAKILRMVAVSGGAEARQIVAYLILEWGVSINEQTRFAKLGIILDDQEICTLAPSVADDYQNKKLGSIMMNHLLQVARQAGRKSMVLMGGTQATNQRAIHFYQKIGFKVVGEFMTDINNYDMILEL